MTVTRPESIVALGEILWDVFPEGARFGGAPANFACHVAALGGQAYMVSGVGADPLGDQALQALQQRQVDTLHVRRFSEFPTGSVDVVVDASGQPDYRFGQNEAWDHLEWSTRLAELASRTDAVAFGTLGQRSLPARRTIQQFVQQVPEPGLCVFDINLRPPYYDAEVIDQSMGLANVLKLNSDELKILSSMYELSGSMPDRLRQLASRFDLRVVALSRGSEGAVLLQGDDVSEASGVDVQVEDTVGAGDAYTAAMVLGLLRGQDLETINRRACRLAAYVCSRSGATPALPDEYRALD